ncbi:FecR family protein [Dyadobacter subterraneus]|uniref:FecR domain-containing protein n=1 Tax=Dyadobacter subterraneus TaxID=2773304 RepID=A0ABR9WKZ5_9BACT|nr:FecR family protein [Dyadobacter subterraneus]MBE9466097.1 FecR domain-containing protein [Dyadobacter subterraneus]
MFKKFAGYSVEDFVKEEKFINWVKFSNPDEDLFWNEFLKKYPACREIIYQARQIVIQLSEASKLPVNQEDVEDIWQHIEAAMTHNQGNRRAVFNLNWIKWVAAASVIMVAGLLWWNNQPENESIRTYTRLVKNADISLKEIINTSAEPIKVTLPDNSVVTLEKNSRLSYTNNFDGKERKVFLSGDAFFNVTKNPDKPFVVYANELVTKVLGTSFRINAFEENKEVTVSVRTGRVFVFANQDFRNTDSGKREVILIPNQKAVFSRKDETLSRSLIDKPEIVVSQEEMLERSFSNAPLPDIFEALERVYGVKLVFDKELFANCRLTTSLGSETLFERLDIICEAVEANYKVVGTDVIIDGKRCN